VVTVKLENFQDSLNRYTTYTQTHTHTLTPSHTCTHCLWHSFVSVATCNVFMTTTVY